MEGWSITFCLNCAIVSSLHCFKYTSILFPPRNPLPPAKKGCASPPKPFLALNKHLGTTGKGLRDAKKDFLPTSKPLADVKKYFYTTPKGLLIVYKCLFVAERAFLGQKKALFLPARPWEAKINTYFHQPSGLELEY